MKLTKYSVQKISIENTLRYDGTVLLTYTIEYPELSSKPYSRCAQKINRYYQERALAYGRYCETTLFSNAIKQYKFWIKHNIPVRPFEVMQVYKVCYLQSCIFSIYFDQYEYTGGAHGMTVRNSQTWDLKMCCLLKLHHFFCGLKNYRLYLLTKIDQEIQAKPENYFEHADQLIQKNFHAEYFYCTPNGIVIYYQLYDIAPYVGGIQEFCIEYNGYVINPMIRCLRE